MSDEHKAALAEGRDQGRVVRRYLEALESHRPKRGRKRTAESIAKRLAAIDDQLAGADALSKLHLTQERMDLQREVATAGSQTGDIGELEAAFIEVARTYGQRKGITYDVWRSIGVEPRVLKAAGIGRS
jgi:hypothetical protein